MNDSGGWLSSSFLCLMKCIIHNTFNDNFQPEQYCSISKNGIKLKFLSLISYSANYFIWWGLTEKSAVYAVTLTKKIIDFISNSLNRNQSLYDYST